MKIITDKVSMDEPCHGLQEVNRLQQMPDGSTQWRRYQCIYVVRGDSIAEFSVDMGSVLGYDGIGEIKLLSLGDDSVGELCDEADRTRDDDTFRKLRDEIVGGSTLWKDFFEEKEQNWKTIRNQSVFGPGITKQRNGFDKRAAYN